MAAGKKRACSHCGGTGKVKVRDVNFDSKTYRQEILVSCRMCHGTGFTEKKLM